MRRARAFILAAAAAACLAAGAPARAGDPAAVLGTWYALALELVRHTPTYSPPVASRAFAYLGVTAYEAVAGGSGGLVSLEGQLHGLAPVPARGAGRHDEAAVLQAALAAAVGGLFANTGPTGQRAMARLGERLRAEATDGLARDIAARSEAHGAAIAAHVAAWAEDDGGAVIENMGFPHVHPLGEGPAAWVPTSLLRQQQTPLLPGWGANRTFVLDGGGDCPVPPPPAYSEDPDSAFFREALEVRDAVRDLGAEEAAIARFWADDPMLSPTPPGHWISIALQVLDAEDADLEQRVEVLALLGVGLADAFTACWHAKFEHDVLRPVTYIRRVIEPGWEPVLTTPPFPEYPSGHSTQSGAAATILTALLGEGRAFEDATHEGDGLPPRSFASFWAAAEEAGMSRLYGGIHFRSAIEQGLEQGRCIGARVTALRTRAGG